MSNIIDLRQRRALLESENYFTSQESTNQVDFGYEMSNHLGAEEILLIEALNFQDSGKHPAIEPLLSGLDHDGTHREMVRILKELIMAEIDSLIVCFYDDEGEHMAFYQDLIDPEQDFLNKRMIVDLIYYEDPIKDSLWAVSFDKDIENDKHYIFKEDARSAYFQGKGSRYRYKTMQN